MMYNSKDLRKVNLVKPIVKALIQNGSYERETIGMKQGNTTYVLNSHVGIISNQTIYDLYLINNGYGLVVKGIYPKQLKELLK